LWATRRIGEIIDDLDLHGRNQELIEELVGLSQRYGILTPYTSFLADDNVRLSAVRENAASAMRFADTQLSVVSGAGGVEQRVMKQQLQNAPVAASAPPPPLKAAQSMQQVGQKTFFRKQGQWQDSTITPAQAANAKHIVQFSREYFDLAAAHGGAMAQYLVFREPVQVNLNGQVYQIDPDTATR
jgi:Ca-activated chloride channel family protein